MTTLKRGMVIDVNLDPTNPLKVWREYRKFTLAVLAKACGVSIPTLSQIENDKRTPSVELLIKLSKSLCMEKRELPSGRIRSGNGVHQVGRYHRAGCKAVAGCGVRSRYFNRH